MTSEVPGSNLKNTTIIDLVDVNGRKIRIRRLNALDRLRLIKAAGPDLSQNDTWLNIAALAVSVIDINNIPCSVPVNERQIEAAVLELGDTGLDAIARALNESEAELPLSAQLGNADGTATL